MVFLQALVNGVDLGSFYALIALGIALIFGVMRLVNFAHGELIMAGSYVFVFSQGASIPILPASLVVVLAVAALAVAMERVAFRPVRRADPPTLLVTSLAVSLLLQNVAMLAFGSRAKSASVPTFFNESWAFGFIQLGKLTVCVVATTTVLVAALVLFLKRSNLGIAMRAAAEDFQTARLVGVSANRVIASAFAISGILAAVAALVLILRTGSVTPTVGSEPIIVAFVATILGGLGSLEGAVIGSYVLGLLTIGLETWLPATLQPFTDSFLYTAVVFILLWRPQGLVNRGWVSREV